jgi:hypothetical protein
MCPLFADAVYQIHEIRNYGVGWGTLSLINAGLAQAKNRSGLNWWFASLFVGPIATFLIVFLDPVPRPHSTAAEA